VTRLGILAGWPVYGLGLRAAIESQPDLLVEWLTGRPKEAAFLASQSPPDATLVDIDLEGALELVHGLNHQAPASVILALAANPQEGWARTAEQAGVRACLAKAVEPLTLAQQLRTLTRAGDAAAAIEGWRPGLSRRELEVLVAVRGGWTSDEIARRLGISSSTVNKHVNGILRKLGARSRAQAAGLLDRVLNNFNAEA
jgi:DNA-binding NarL/FixJ family response regulator